MNKLKLINGAYSLFEIIYQDKHPLEQADIQLMNDLKSFARKEIVQILNQLSNDEMYLNEINNYVNEK